MFEEPDWIVMSKLPLVTPCVLSVRVKTPVAVVPAAKHDDGVIKLKFVTLTVLPLWASVAVKPKAVVPSGLRRNPFQFPLSGSVSLLELNPQASKASVMERIIAVPKYLIKLPLLPRTCGSRKARAADSACQMNIR